MILIYFRQHNNPSMASVDTDGEPGKAGSAKKRKSTNKTAKKPKQSLVMTMDFNTGKSEVFGLEPEEDPRFNQRQLVTAADLAQANIPRREDLQDTVFVEFDHK